MATTVTEESFPPVRQAFLHLSRRLLGIELLRVEVAAPFHEIFVLLVLLIGKCFKILVEAADATHIFGRAGPLALKAERVFLAEFLLGTALKTNLVFPPIAKIVFVGKAESLPRIGGDVAHLGAGRVHKVELIKTIFKKFGIAVPLVEDFELVEMRVGPAHRGLDVFVKLVEGAILDLNTSPNRRLRANQRDLKLVDRVRISLGLRLFGLSLFCLYWGRKRRLKLIREVFSDEQQGRLLVGFNIR